MQVGDLVKQHLNSIGTEQARVAVKTRAVEGTLQFRIVNGGAGNGDGKQVFISEGDKLVSLLKLPNPSYHGERFVTDGRKIVVAELKPGVYSNLGQFVLSNNEIVTDGLWGGTLSTAWPLAHLDERHAKLKYQGLKKVDGRELHRVDYTTSKHTNLEIQLFFEPDTFRHVETIYSVTISPPIAHSDRETARQQETHYILEERFADFKTVDGLTLPGRWTLQFTSDVPEVSISGHTRFGASLVMVTQFETTVTNISHNVQLDPKNFEIK
ncbi:MAG TPA: hypothetical protein VJX69_05350 [Terriglobales bacterium]|nr:hypothetical protein [Terriglobales bacterium]